MVQGAAGNAVPLTPLVKESLVLGCLQSLLEKTFQMCRVSLGLPSVLSLCPQPQLQSQVLLLCFALLQTWNTVSTPQVRHNTAVL